MIWSWTIYSYLSVPDLKACRQVCQQWKQASLRSLVEKCNPVRFARKGFIRFCPEFRRIDDMAKLSSISTSISSEFPVTKSSVEANIITESPGNMYGPEEKLLREFFQAIGPLATELEIGFMDRGKVYQLDAPLNVQFPRLKTLKGRTSLGDLSIIRSGSKLTLFDNILENAPQLSTLDIDCVCPETVDLLINLMERVLPKRKMSISALHLHNRTFVLDNHFHRLANIGLKLNSLRLRMAFNSSLNEVGEGWMKFLESQSETLEELCLNAEYNYCNYAIRRRQDWPPTVGFPPLRKLKSLDNRCDDTIKFSGIVYSKQFPSLEQISLAYNGNNISEAFLNSDLPPVETVEILKLPIALYDPVWIWHAARIFPNVKKLKMSGQREIVQAVFQAWKNVEELTIEHLSLFRESANELLAVNFEGVLPSNCSLNTSGVPAKFLQGLKTLRLEDTSGKYLPKTWICQFVLLKMNSLKCKCRNPESMIGEPMLSTMRKKFLVLC